MNPAVLRHYDEKYAGETSGAAPAPVPLTTRPRDRFEAAVSGVHARFSGGAVLEIGAGSGRVARGLLDAGLPCERYVATDLSTNRLAGMRASIDDPRVEVRPFDLDEPDPALEGQFDAVLLVALIEHVFDPLRALAAVRRLLRPGGFALVDTPNVAKYTRRLKLVLGRFPSTASLDEGLQTYDGRPVDLYDEGHLHYFTFRSLERLLLERCGFARIERVPYATPPFFGLPRLADSLAARWPTLFSELCVVAYAPDSKPDGDPSRRLARAFDPGSA